jgi:hypothetical protein
MSSAEDIMLSYQRSNGSNGVNGSNGFGKLPEILLGQIKYGDVYGEASSTDPQVNAMLAAVVTNLNVAAAAFKLQPVLATGVISFTAAQLAVAIANRVQAEGLTLTGAPAELLEEYVGMLMHIRAPGLDDKAIIRYLAENADKLNSAFLAAANAKTAADAAALIKETERKAAEAGKSKAGVYLSWGAVILLVAAGGIGTYYLVRHYKRRQRPELAPAY